MVESLIAVADILPVAIFFGFLLVVFSVGLWYVKKTTGRPVRDMLAVLGGAITFILLMVPPMIFFWDRVNSPDRHTREVTKNIFIAVYLPIVVLISWAFNKLAKRSSKRKKRGDEDNHLIGKVNSPDSR